jgi:hypothetical protein
MQHHIELSWNVKQLCAPCRTAYETSPNSAADQIANICKSCRDNQMTLSLPLNKTNAAPIKLQEEEEEETQLFNVLIVGNFDWISANNFTDLQDHCNVAVHAYTDFSLQSIVENLDLFLPPPVLHQQDIVLVLLEPSDFANDDSEPTYRKLTQHLHENTSSEGYCGIYATFALNSKVLEIVKEVCCGSTKEEKESKSDGIRQFQFVQEPSKSETEIKTDFHTYLKNIIKTTLKQIEDKTLSS